MQPIYPQPLLNHLEKKAILHRLSQDLIICYPNQIITTAVWLKTGTIRLNENMKDSQDFQGPGLYFMDDVSTQRPCPYFVKVIKGSEIWLVTRSDVQTYLLELLA